MRAKDRPEQPGARKTRESQIIPLSAPPLGELPLWGKRVEFDHFLVELVPWGKRAFNVRLPETFASINFGPAEGTSSLAGDRLRSYDRRPFEFIIAPPRFPLKGETDDAPEVLAFVIKFDQICDTLATALEVSHDAIRPQVVLGHPEPYITTLAKKIQRHFLARKQAPYYLESLCLNLLVEMFRPIAERRTRKVRHSVDRNTLDSLLKYIDANLEGDLGLARLADLVGVTPDHLSRTFKKAIGETAHSYVIQRRTDEARRLLTTHDYPIAEIAYATGFSSQSHMTTAFRKLLGTTPGHFRQRR